MRLEKMWPWGPLCFFLALYLLAYLLWMYFT